MLVSKIFREVSLPFVNIFKPLLYCNNLDIPLVIIVTLIQRLDSTSDEPFMFCNFKRIRRILIANCIEFFEIKHLLVSPSIESTCKIRYLIFKLAVSNTCIFESYSLFFVILVHLESNNFSFLSIQNWIKLNCLTSTPENNR